ncbi:3-isopropylmalate dehydratase large subunit [Schnuerera sp. xch1]|uniref:3-isopropylmalate dehydratase large subunit n=1 Tax=Schnuerera sp. xch1 TaxID=2874283 RepID=UPI001CBCADA9|nr:3-isopropylmalate dehydratase large subunit [Schnuerera sp. xch1]MBZ2174026.1 3-isopropylmalate dehydratase large subunit [Schnuerera sp. xch1]
MHAIEKILANNAGLDKVEIGQIVTCNIDFAEINDLYLQTIYSFWEMGGKKVFDKNKVAFVFDHYSPAPTIKTAQIHKEMREFVKDQGLTHHFDINKGICHQVMPESGLIYPGMIIVATDSHTTTHGAFGAFGTGVGATDMATILISGKLWFRVPEIINIEINGIPSKNTYAKDVILYIVGKVKANGAVYKAIEFSGDYVEKIDVSERMTICNMAVEMGAKTAYMAPNKAVIDYVNSRATKDYTIYEIDEGYEYSEHLVFNIDGLEPQLAVPHSVDNNVSVKDGVGTKIHQAFIGSCTGGRFEDIETAWKILKGKKIHPDVRLVIIPASDEIQLSIIEKRYMRDLIKAGVTFSAPGCGPCLGTHAGIIADDEVCITSTNRNFPGRMGSNKASIYLASPATVAASALNGYITEPIV